VHALQTCNEIHLLSHHLVRGSNGCTFLYPATHQSELGADHMHFLGAFRKENTHKYTLEI
jgi:hypothetical protein